MLNTNETNADLSIKQIIANDIKKYAEEMNLPIRQVIKEFAENTNIVRRTLERILGESKVTNPHVTTVVDIYSQIYNTSSMAEIISKAPESISEFIKKNHMQFISTNGNKYLNISNHPAKQAELTSSTIFNQIYMMTSGNYGTDLDAIREQFGSNGLKQLDEMIKLGFVEVDEDDKIVRKNKLTWDRKIRRNFSKSLINEVFNEENADVENPNYISFAVGEVSPEDFNLIREKIKSNYLEVMNIINDSKPTKENAIKFAMSKVIEKIEFKVEGDKLC